MTEEQHFVVYLGNPSNLDSTDLIILKSVTEEHTGITLYREFCRIRNRGRHSVERANKLAQKLNETPYISWSYE